MAKDKDKDKKGLTVIGPDDEGDAGRLSETADFATDFAAAMRSTLHPDVYERLAALNELYGEIGYRAILSMLITESYMDRVAAFRDAEGEG